MGELATRFGCSRRHLNRLFHQYFGLSVAALRMEMRMLKAISLLRDAANKVINVAEKCGFNHLGLFNSCFKRRFGVSPGQWRKQAGNGEARPGEHAEDAASCPLRSKGLCPMTGDAQIHLPLLENAGTRAKSAAAGPAPGPMQNRPQPKPSTLAIPAAIATGAKPPSALPVQP